MPQVVSVGTKRETEKLKKRKIAAKAATVDPSLEFSQEAKCLFRRWIKDIADSGEDISYPLAK